MRFEGDHSKMEKYRRKAYELVSVSGADYERIKAENARVLAMAADKDRNTDLGSKLPSYAALEHCIDERLDLWHRIIRSYAEMYQQNPMLNKWCLLASIVGETLLLPSVRRGAAMLQDSDSQLPAELRQALESWVASFLLTNVAVYKDIISAHLAFYASDTEAMAELPGYFQQLLPLWLRAKREYNERNSIDANRLLIDREQGEVATAIFLQFPDGMKFITSTGKLEWPRLFKEFALKADLNPYWPDPTLSYAPAEPRTSWLHRGYDAYLRWVAKSDNGVERHLQFLTMSKL